MFVVGCQMRLKHRLRSEKLLWILFRTGVRFPSPPPKIELPTFCSGTGSISLPDRQAYASFSVRQTYVSSVRILLFDYAQQESISEVCRVE